MRSAHLSAGPRSLGGRSRRRDPPDPRRSGVGEQAQEAYRRPGNPVPAVARGGRVPHPQRGGPKLFSLSRRTINATTSSKSSGGLATATPETERNEFKGQYYGRRETAFSRFGVYDERARLYVLHGEPDGLYETSCGLVLWPDRDLALQLQRRPPRWFQGGVLPASERWIVPVVGQTTTVMRVLLAYGGVGELWDRNPL